MIEAAQKAMIHVMDLRREDRVLVVTDDPTRAIGDAFFKAAETYGCKVELHVLPERDRPLAEVSPEMAALLEGKDAVINAFKGFSEETPFRVKWIDRITESKKIRLGHCPGITKSMMTEGPMNVDYRAMVKTADRLMKAFENAKSVHITAPAGTDIVVGIEDRGFLTDVHITAEHAGNLPCGEIFCAPEETEADGVLVIDGSFGDVGNVPKPLRITVKAGRADSFESEDPELVAQVEKLTGIDEEARVIGELGIGLNPGAKLTGNLLEDEKAFRTAHIAFGNNKDMPGGRNRSQTHRDFLFYDPTMKVTYKDGSKRTLIDKGQIL
jgi:leucyl aminopeptidase (aminopeptidase T)